MPHPPRYFSNLSQPARCSNAGVRASASGGGYLDNSVLTLNNTYGPLWQQPITIVQGRVIKFGLQADF